MKRRLPIIIYTKRPQKMRQRKSVIKTNRSKNHRRKLKLNLLMFILIMIASIVAAPVALKNKDDDKGQPAGTLTQKSNIINEVKANAKLNEYEFYYYPIVTNNIENYSSDEDYDNEKLLLCVIWSLLRDKQRGTPIDNYVVLRAEDVENEHKKIFGKKNKPNHATIKTNEYKIIYNEKSQTYKIPIIGTSPKYIPELESVEQKGMQIILCIAGLNSGGFKQNSKGQTVKPKAEKYLYIYLKKSSGEYFVDKVESHNKIL